MVSFNKNYFLLFIILLVVEVIIAIYVRDQFVRPYAGDFLAVILLYVFQRGFLNISVYLAAATSLLFAYFLEILQFFSIIKRFGLQEYKILTILIGNHFEWSDMIAYTLGIFTVIAAEEIFHKKKAD